MALVFCAKWLAQHSPRPNTNDLNNRNCVKNILRIYADEAGTMPLTDSDEPFVAAMVSLVGAHPEQRSPNGRTLWLIEKLLHLGARPSCKIIKPFPGYGNALANKFTKMDEMAKVTLRKTGANALYITEAEGLRFRNMIWSYAMFSALQDAMLRAVIHQTIDGIEVYFDQKTMVAETRAFCLQAFNNLIPRLRHTIKSVEFLNPTHASAVFANIKFDAVSVHWSDEPNMDDAEAGITLAHYLSSLNFRDLRKGKRHLAEKLIESGFSNTEEDITLQLVKPLGREVVQTWEQNTGLKY